MSKRRNLKKEKAERNKAYARKFRKTASKRFSSSKRFNGKKKESDDSSAQEQD